MVDKPHKVLKESERGIVTYKYPQLPKELTGVEPRKEPRPSEEREHQMKILHLDTRLFVGNQQVLCDVIETNEKPFIETIWRNNESYFPAFFKRIIKQTDPNYHYDEIIETAVDMKLIKKADKADR